ncbi:MAG: hypothetical protein M9928_08000 [Anaerolineae bacterium]|nr:hypothetical protein [Anaerolineae bacterium]MCO5193474.1 hypothetical protein [Anaerolineae bacterium]MCO5197412.1 hypothetical protein [Anaerolineae bacterium]MCO5204957.1 hypothetical protein [Anaerolineae bacterium]
MKFNYLYRDAGNYKSWGELIFSNPDELNLEEVDRLLRLAFDQEIIFIAHQIDVPELFLYAKDDLNDDDHCFHEYDSVELAEVADSRLDSRSIKQFLQQVEFASISGWKAFSPLKRLAKIRKYSN